MFYHVLRTSFSTAAGLTLRCNVTGKDNLPRRGACIVVANHVNLLDSPILGVRLGRKVYFMAKEEIFHPRVMGWMAEQFGAFPVIKGRINRRAGRTALELLSSNQALMIYPEGKRSEDGKLGPAYTGAALLAMKSGASIVPVGIIGTSQLKGKWWFLKRPKITLNIGQPFTLSVSSTEKFSKEETACNTREIMMHIADLIPPEYRGRYTR